MPNTMTLDSGPRAATEASPPTARHSLSRLSGIGLALGLVLSTGCFQDYSIHSLDGDDGAESGPASSVADPAGSAAPSGAADSSTSVGSPLAPSTSVEPGGGLGTDVLVPERPDEAIRGGFDPGRYVYESVEPGGDATDALEDPQNREREDQFELGAELRAPMVDFLFVVDNSTSMGRIRDLVRSGLVSLYDDDPFPAESRIAVMSTIPADPADLTRLHPRVNDQGGQINEPGFLRLVDAEGIEVFRNKAPELGNSFRFAGCENAWFEPWEENADGVPCLVAHTQISRTPIRVEAGLSALQQFLQKQSGTQTFREGAAVHVIFVSDTHSPGLSGGPNRLRKTGLEVDPITYSDLKALVDGDNLVSSFKVHAIAPATECVEEWAHLGPRYFDVATASGGATLDICTAEDYAPFIRGLVETSDIVDSPVFGLGRPSAEVHEVLVNGQSVPFDLVGDGTAVRLRGIDRADAKRNLTVRYRY